ncbi:uncharacterized protein METZ01_LOCUS350752, partial [marine metagenome]
MKTANLFKRIGATGLAFGVLSF